MELRRVFLALLLAAAITLSSCAGPSIFGGGGSGGGGGGGGGGTGTAKFSLILTDTPPAGVTILSFDLTVTGATLSNAAGSPTPLLALPKIVELSHLQTDFAALGTFTIFPDTFTQMQISFANPSITFANQSGGTIGGCPNNTICNVKPASAGSFTFTTGAFPFVVSGGDRVGLRLDFNLANALTSTMNVDFTQPGILSVARIPNTPTGQIASFDDLWGTVSNISTANKTFLFTSRRDSFTPSVDANTVFDGFSACSDIACLQDNQIVSVDLGLNGDGTVVAKEIQLEETLASTDQLEGLITSVDSATQFRVVSTAKLQAGPNDFLRLVDEVGEVVSIALSASPTFDVSTKGLPVPATPLTQFQGATDTAQLAPGQRVTMRIISDTGGVFTTDRVRLRFSRPTGTVSGAPSSPFFNIDGLPLLFGFVNPVQAQTFGTQTNFENVADVNGLGNGDTVSIRALYFKNSTPAFCANKVRKR